MMSLGKSKHRSDPRPAREFGRRPCFRALLRILTVGCWRALPGPDRGARGAWSGGVWLGAWLLLVTPAAALDPDRKPSSYSVQCWLTEHGLPSNKIRALAQTRDGYLWIATGQGLARFDGNHFTVFSGVTHPELRGGGFFAVLEAPDGRLWFGGDNGLFLWRNGRFDHFTTEQGLANNYVRGLSLARDGTVVALTLTGYSFVRGERISTPEGVWKQVTGVARAYVERTDGSSWLGTSDGLWRISGEHIERLSGTTEFQGDAFSCLLETSDGSLWIGYSGGMRRVRLDGSGENYAAAQGLTDLGVAALQSDRDGNLWIGTYSGEIFRMSRGRIEATTYAEQFGGTPVRQLYEDREGGLWIATAAGLFRLKDNMGSSIGTAEGMSHTSVFAVFEAQNGAWWIGLWGGGVYRYDQVRATRLGAPESLGLDQVLSFAEEPPGTLWIGAVSGLYRQDGGGITNLYDRGQAAALQQQLAEKPDAPLPGLAHSRANAIAPDGAGGLWIATDGALYHGREGSYRVYSKSNGLPGNLVKSVLRARNGDIWITAPPEGVARLHENQWTSYLCGQALSAIAPRAAYEDGAGTIWVTTEGGGLNRFKGGRWRTFTAHDGLADDFISGITEDSLGNLWVACPRGIMRIPREQFDEFDAGRRATLLPRIFNRSDGLPSAESNHRGSPSAWRARDGRLLFATDRGVAVIEPGNLKINQLVPPIYVERFVVNGADADLSRPPVVPPGNNDVQIHYTAISLLAPEKVRFKIRLAPLDRDWVDAGGQREVRYAKLPPGAYTFRVIACNTDGVWNEQGVTQTFTVQPHFYQTAWFTGLMLLIVGGALVGFYWTRQLKSAKEAAEATVKAKNEFIDALKQAEAEREELHRQLLETSRQAGMAEVATSVLHNVGNVLNSVNVSATLVTDNTKRSAVPYLGKVAALLNEHAGDLAAFMTDDPKGRQLPRYLSQLAEQLEGEQNGTIAELETLRKNIEHIKDVVAMQQNYARICGVTEIVSVTDLVEDALNLNAAGLDRHGIKVVREYAAVPPVTIEKHKALQILVNLIRNAKQACRDSGRADKQLRMRVAGSAGQVRISVIDNGVGIPPENLTRIFNHGFTTRKDGHGFGLHNGALAAKEMGGALIAHSDGPGRGATFTLELPTVPTPPDA